MKHYETEKQEAVQVLARVAENGGDAYIVLLGSIVSALYDIANELHEINKKVNTEVDDGR